MARARASATRCCWPPDSCHGKRSPRPSRWMRSSSSATRRSMSALGRFRILSPKPMLLATFMFGNSAYDWKTMPTLRWFGARWVTSVPSIATVPAVGRSKPAIMRNVVVLPQPDGPRNETNSPRSAARSKCWTAATSPNRFWMPLSSRKAMGLLVSLASAGDRDSAARTAPEQRDEAHGDPRQPEADQGDRGLLVRGDISQLREVDREDLAGKESRDRELADHDGEGQEGSAQQRDPQVR